MTQFGSPEYISMAAGGYSFTGYSFIGYSFTGYSFTGYSFIGYSFRGYSFIGYSFTGYSFIGYSFTGYSFTGYSFIGYSFFSTSALNRVKKDRGPGASESGGGGGDIDDASQSQKLTEDPARGEMAEAGGKKPRKFKTTINDRSRGSLFLRVGAIGTLNGRSRPTCCYYSYPSASPYPSPPSSLPHLTPVAGGTFPSAHTASAQWR
ncbi:unnamed protein product [Cyprideis torosa]|uniref:Uncharacterized protein n=1 Tax=Cyprideis torosa TaxID=163714 RepID=A0A7R8ZJT5_9CRUS|nr:unnamed protein product [Cyprideis torosa]CAG0889207.1 unnamed protein product [Cyprideis torosa]